MTKRRKTIPKAVRMKMPKRTYQPSRDELRKKVKMPGLSLREARRAFFRPFKFESD